MRLAQSRLLAALVLAWVLPAAAHHSIAAEYDSSKVVTITGKVTKLVWQNPHAFLYIDVKDPKTGHATNWSIELGSVNSLARLGWTQNSVKIESVATAQGIRALAGGTRILAQDVTFADNGQRLRTSSSAR